jgi:hypothetical protein
LGSVAEDVDDVQAADEKVVDDSEIRELGEDAYLYLCDGLIGGVELIFHAEQRIRLYDERGVPKFGDGEDVTRRFCRRRHFARKDAYDFVALIIVFYNDIIRIVRVKMPFQLSDKVVEIEQRDTLEQGQL